MDPLRIGFHFDLDADTYHADESVSKSMLDALNVSPFHCWAQHLAPPELRVQRKSTGSMSAGTLLHCLALEPGAFDKRYTVRPAGLDLRTKDGKTWAADVPQGVQIISADQHETAKSQLAALMAVPEIQRALERAMTEVSGVWIDKGTGLRCRARYDAWASGAPILVDVKTASDITPDGFARSVATYGYHRQQAHYSAGFRALTGQAPEMFLFAAVSSAAPFVAVPYLLDAEAVAQGEAEIRHLLELFARCKESNRWPGPGDSGIQTVGLPRWALPQEEMEVSYDD